MMPFCCLALRRHHRELQEASLLRCWKGPQMPRAGAAIGGAQQNLSQYTCASWEGFGGDGDHSPSRNGRRLQGSWGLPGPPRLISSHTSLGGRTALCKRGRGAGVQELMCEWLPVGVHVRACDGVYVRVVINEAKHENVFRRTCTEKNGFRSPGRGTFNGTLFSLHYSL